MARASFRLLFAAPAVTILLSGCDIKVEDVGEVSSNASRGKASDEWVRSFTLPKDGRFEIANENGEILVKGTQGTEVKVTAHRELRAGSEEEAQRRLKELKMTE